MGARGAHNGVYPSHNAAAVLCILLLARCLAGSRGPHHPLQHCRHALPCQGGRLYDRARGALLLLQQFLQPSVLQPSVLQPCLLCAGRHLPAWLLVLLWLLRLRLCAFGVHHNTEWLAVHMCMAEHLTQRLHHCCRCGVLLCAARCIWQRLLLLRLLLLLVLLVAILWLRCFTLSPRNRGSG